MIRNQSQCPYCSACVVAYDWDADKIIFNPDLARPNPCAHVAYIGVYCLTLGQMFAHRHTIWLHVTADRSLAEYLRGICVGVAVPDATYKITDARHEHHHNGGIDGVTFCSIYSPDPEEFLRACLVDMRENWKP